MTPASSSPAEPSPQMVELVQRALDGEASAQDEKLLNESLAQDPGFLSYFVEMRLLHGALENEFEPGITAAGSAPNRPIPFPSARPSLNRAAPSHGAGRKLAMVAALLLLATLAAFWGVSKSLHRPAFEVVASEGVNQQGLPANGEWVKTRQTIELEQGVIELVSADSNRFVFEGPGSLTVHDTGELTLSSGKLWASLDGEPVLIHTPRGEVRDLGTIFGIDASKPSALRVDVFEGRVRLSKADDKSQAVDAAKGESLISQGSDWQPHRGVADASLYRSGVGPQPLAAGIAVLDSGWSAMRRSMSINDEHLGHLDLTGASKLVVTIAIGFEDENSHASRAERVTYNGSPMTLAAESSKPSDRSPAWVGIYYLDDPASVGAGHLLVSHSGMAYHVSALVLSGTADGVGKTVVTDTAESVDLQASSGSMVVAASSRKAAPAKEIAADVTQVSEPFSLIYKFDGMDARRMGKIYSAAAYHAVSGDQTMSPAFLVSGKAEINIPTTVAVEFLPAESQRK